MPRRLNLFRTNGVSHPNPAPGSEIILYQTEDGRTRLEVKLENETVWLTQQHMSELFQTTKQNISLHLQNIFDEGELTRKATVKESLTVQLEGGRSVRRKIEFYNLDAIISVGYRVKSAVATRFRIWATQKLREFIVKGFPLPAVWPWWCLWLPSFLRLRWRPSWQRLRWPKIGTPAGRRRGDAAAIQYKCFPPTDAVLRRS